MKNILLLICLSVLPFVLPAQYSQELGPFHKVSMFGSLEVRLVQGESPRLELPNHAFLPERFRIKVENGKLSLRLVPKVKDWEEQPIQVVIVYDRLDELWVHAGAQLEADRPLVAEEIKLEGTTGARVELEVEADRLETYVTEGAEVTLSGKVFAQRVKVNTGGQYHGYDLEVDRLEAKANTGGEAYVKAYEKLKASAHMGGSIYYKGNPVELETDSGVAGSINDF